MSISSWLVLVSPLLTFFWYFGHIIYAVGIFGVILGFLSIVTISAGGQNPSANTATANAEPNGASEQQ